MSYQNETIKDMLDKIGNNALYLPAIQRKFVWEYPQIESLFDSLMRDYPIGTFLFWSFKTKKKNEYVFYKFLQEYHERDKCINEMAPRPHLKKGILGVLDGQQRLSSLYIALQGSYAYKKPYARRDDSAAYPKRKLYLNIFKAPEEKDEEGYIWEFKFLTDEESKEKNEEHCWFLVREVLTWKDMSEVYKWYSSFKNKIKDPALTNFIEQKMDIMIKALSRLWQVLVNDQVISYYVIQGGELDDILDIFVRVNSGGTPLEKSDLLFSTIVANWEQGRDEIEEFIKSINGKGEGFKFDNDFMMRSCLVLTDCPVLFKVKGFKKENIYKIKNNWEEIKVAINKTVILLTEFGFNRDNLTSLNAVIPIAYYFIKNGKDDACSKSEIRKFLIHSLINQIYGGQSDQVLSNIRDFLRVQANNEFKLKSKEFDFKQFTDIKLPGKKILVIPQENVDEILKFKKGPYSFMILSLLYPAMKFGQNVIHQDHIHPDSFFTDAKLRKNGIPNERWEIWQEIKDELPNLQLMRGKENESKNKTPFKEWFLGKDSSGKTNVENPEAEMKENYLPDKTSLEFKDFELFFMARKQLLREVVSKLMF